MMISPVFLVTLLSILYSRTSNSSAISAELVNQTIAVSANANADGERQSFERKFDVFLTILERVDLSLQHIQEQQHSWSIFRHHIDAWNEQMKSLEHKLELVKRQQDEQLAFGNKLISLEFTLNHILSKVVLLSDNNHRQAPNPAADELITPNEALKDIQRALNADKKARSDLSSRLSNILRHVQNIERDKCRPPTVGAAAMGPQPLMLPVGGCNATQRYNYNVDQALHGFEERLKSLETNLVAKDFKKMNALTKKNALDLQNVLNYVANTDKIVMQWQETHADGLNQVLKHCQAVSGELSTFTESSDLLLKRIEYVVRDVNEKLKCVECRERSVEETDNENAGEAETSAEATDDSQEATNNTDDEDGDQQVNTEKSSIDVDISHENVTESDNADKVDAETVEFLQPLKNACHELESPRVDGVYTFSSSASDFKERLCAYPTTGPAWTVIQARGPHAVQENFNRSWLEYRNGFGDLHGEFWFGNEFIHQMVFHDDYQLRIELEDFDGVQVWAEYSIFRVDSERYNYNLLIGGYRGTVPDAMQYHNELDFSTYDRRNDRSVDACCACATGYASGWWFDNCSEANLNGIYRDTPLGHNYVGIIWKHWHGDYSLKRTRMLIRPLIFASTDDVENELLSDLNEDP